MDGCCVFSHIFGGFPPKNVRKSKFFVHFSLKKKKKGKNSCVSAKIYSRKRVRIFHFCEVKCQLYLVVILILVRKLKFEKTWLGACSDHSSFFGAVFGQKSIEKDAKTVKNQRKSAKNMKFWWFLTKITPKTESP